MPSEADEGDDVVRGGTVKHDPKMMPAEPIAIEGSRGPVRLRVGKFFGVAAGLALATGALAACGSASSSDAGPSASVVPAVAEPSEPSPASEEGGATGDFGPQGSEKAQFEASLEIPSTSDATAVGRKYVDIISAISNIGVNKGAPDVFDNDISLILKDFSFDFVNDWRDEFATAFDSSSPQSSKLLNGLAIGASNYLVRYLETVDNGKAHAVFHEDLWFVAALEEDPVGCDRQVLITYHARSNMGDTGLSPLPNVDTDATVRVKFNDIDGILRIADVVAIGQ